MGRSNLLKMVLSIIYRKHEKGVIADIKQAACEDAAVDKLTKGAADDLLDEAWAMSLEDSDTFKALFDEVRAACRTYEIPTTDDDEADGAESDGDEADGAESDGAESDGAESDGSESDGEEASEAPASPSRARSGQDSPSRSPAKRRRK